MGSAAPPAGRGWQARCVAVQRFSQSGDENFVGPGHIARDDQDGGVEQIDRAGDDFADVAAAVADHATGFGIAAVGQVHNVAQVTDWAALLLKRANQRPSTGDRFQAAGVAAAAWHTGCRGGLVVSELARRLRRRRAGATRRR